MSKQLLLVVVLKHFVILLVFVSFQNLYFELVNKHTKVLYLAKWRK